MSKTPRIKLSSEVRLNKFIADCGICSRRKADQLIEDGKVTVNGKKVFELGLKVEPKIDKVLVEGHPIKAPHEKFYMMLNKPKSVMTTMNDPEGRRTVAEFVEHFPVRMFPVGRLDWDTEGLLLFTNDGDFANTVTHPKEEIPKTYLAKVDGQPTDEHLTKLLKGVTIVGGKVKALTAERIKRGDSKQYSWVKIVITEGKNRQIRHMFEKIGFDVLKLQRVAIGRLTLGGLAAGETVLLNVESLMKIFETDLPVKSAAKAGKVTKKVAKKKKLSIKRPGQVEKQKIKSKLPF
jgi:23S rRNA pseudouridine2605 synthase